MFNIIKRRSTHASKLERWIGADQVEQMAAQVRHWYGPPIAVAGVPGAVYARGGGDFVGPIAAGKFGSLADLQFERMKRIMREMSLEARLVSGVGFTSLSDMISKWTQDNKGQTLLMVKPTSVTGVTGRANTTWYSSGTPVAGAAGAAAPGGTANAKGDTGSYPIINTTTGSEGLFLVSGFAQASTSPQSILLYDRLFSCAKTMSSSASEAVTGVPVRYTSTTSTDWNYAGGNFIAPEVTSALSATAHNWTVMQYTNQAGVTASIAPSVAGVSSAAANSIDLPAGYWFMPLASNDIGVTALTQMQCSAAALTGDINWVVGHPLAMMPCLANYVYSPQDFTNSAFGLTRMYDTACLAYFLIGTSATGGTSGVSINVLAG